MQYIADLHNHSCLSPCGSLDMSPKLLAKEAAEKGIDILALTDHNSGRNLRAFAECCRVSGITPIFGIEVNTFEEVHVVCLFEELEQAESYGDYIETLLPGIKNQPEIFGDQVAVDANEEIISFVEPLLFSSISRTYFELIPEVLELGGLAIPAHIDRAGNGAVSQLGFLPDIPYSAVELLRFPSEYSTYDNTIITGSDAHHPQDIGRRAFRVSGCSHPTFSELVRAFEEKRVILQD